MRTRNDFSVPALMLQHAFNLRSSLIDADAMRTAVDKAIERAEKESKTPGVGAGQTRKVDLGEKAEIGDRVRREMLANVVLLRLKVTRQP